MNQITTFFRLRFGWMWKEDVKTLKMQVFLNDVVSSEMFGKMTSQEKLMSLCRIIEIFRKDYGFTPKSLERHVKALTVKQDEDMAKLWEQSYTQYFEEKKK